MGGKFFVPAATMISALVIWVGTIVLFEMVDGLMMDAPWLATGLALVVCGLVVYSGFRCKAVGGPRMGSVARVVFLLVMGAVVCWRIACGPALLFWASAVVMAVLWARTPPDPPAEHVSGKTSA